MSAIDNEIDNLATRQLIDQAATQEEELVAARAVQRFLLPPEEVLGPGWRMTHVYQPLHHIGGDFLDLHQNPCGSLTWMIADVAGHGISAAMSTALLKAAFARHAPVTATPAELLSAINYELRGLVRPGRFVTAMAGIYDPHHGVLTLASAGHPCPIVMRHAQAAEFTIDPELPLLIEETHVYRQTEQIRLAPDDRFLVFTDGVLEAEIQEDRQLGVDGFCTLLRTAPGAGVAFLQAVYEKLFFGDVIIRDDVTLMALEAI